MISAMDESDTPLKLPVPEYIGGRTEKSALKIAAVWPPSKFPCALISESLALSNSDRWKTEYTLPRPELTYRSRPIQWPWLSRNNWTSCQLPKVCTRDASP